MLLDSIRHPKLKQWIEEAAKMCTPDSIYVCDGSKDEYNRLMQQMVNIGMATPLAKRPNSFLFRSDPSDVARVESRTFIATEKKADAGPTNNWMRPDALKEEMLEEFSGSMKGHIP